MIPLPPREFVDAVGGDFELVGNHILKLVIEYCGLPPNARILDVGSGCGRFAVPLTQYLSSKGSYEGFDISSGMVDWCKQHISSCYPNFGFRHAPLTNTFYQPEGQNAASFTFPYDPESFDVVVATSVFTHLVPDSARRYATEIARLMKPEARGVVTFFLLNDEYRARRDAGLVNVTFDHPCGIARAHDPERPEVVIAYEEGDALGMLRAAGLSVDHVAFGSWARGSGRSGQDWVVVSRARRLESSGIGARLTPE